jgi:hypothetical protein
MWFFDGGLFKRKADFGVFVFSLSELRPVNPDQAFLANPMGNPLVFKGFLLPHLFLAARTDDDHSFIPKSFSNPSDPKCI